jgi:hypothetical protein
VPQTLSCALNADVDWVLPILDKNGAAITTALAGDPLQATVWMGDDQAALFHPSLTWIDNTQGTTKLTVAAAQTAALAAGVYRLECYWIPNNLRRRFFNGFLELEHSAGSAAALSTYCSYNDLLAYAPQVAKLAAADDQSLFAEERHNARLLFESKVLDRYRPQPGRTRRYVDATGLLAGPFLRYADPPIGSAVPTSAQIAAYLTANKLVVSEDIIRCNALLAAAFVYQANPGAQNVYQQLGQQAAKDAQAQFEQSTLEFDTNSDGTPELRIDRDVTFLT